MVFRVQNRARYHAIDLSLSLSYCHREQRWVVLQETVCPCAKTFRRVILTRQQIEGGVNVLAISETLSESSRDVTVHDSRCFHLCSRNPVNCASAARQSSGRRIGQ